MSHAVYKLPPLSNGRANGTTSSSAANGGGDGDKIRQLQRLLLGVTKAIQTYLLEDIGMLYIGQVNFGPPPSSVLLLFRSNCHGINS
jgi:hypothetical protein